MRAGKGFTLFFSNDGMNDIINSLEDSGVLVDGVTETVKREITKRRLISWSFVSTFIHFNSATNDFYSSKRYKWQRS